MQSTPVPADLVTLLVGLQLFVKEVLAMHFIYLAGQGRGELSEIEVFSTFLGGH